MTLRYKGPDDGATMVAKMREKYLSSPIHCTTCGTAIDAQVPWELALGAVAAQCPKCADAERSTTGGGEDAGYGKNFHQFEFALRYSCDECDERDEDP